MSVFFDHHSRRPKVWTYIFFGVVPLAVFLAIYLYGMSKAKDLPPEEQKNSIFEDSK